VSVESTVGIPSFLDGVPADAAADILERLETQHFPAGSVVVAEGDQPRLLYLAESGTADVLVGERRVGGVQPGTTVGEMSFFTGQPASATVRAVDDFVAHAISERELERIATAHPQIYRNLAAILSSRLARTNRLAARTESAKVVLLQGGPPIVAYALACSIAWHSRRPTALLVAGEAPALEQFAASNGTPGPRATVIFDRSMTDGGVAALVESLSASQAMVLVLAPRATPPALADAQTAELPSGLELDAADEDALRAGLLPSTTAAGRTVGRLARQLSGLTVGLALGAGGLRGFAHVGVLRALERLGLEADIVVGTSIGAAVGAGYVLGHDAEETGRLLGESARTIFKPTVPIKGFLTSAPLGRYLKENLPGRIEDLRLPFGIVTADLTTHTEVVLRRGVLWRAALASMSIPGIFPAQRMGSMSLVDGGVVNAVPAGVAADMGAANVIAIRLLNFPETAEMDIESIEERGTPPPALSAILRAFEIMQARTSREVRADAATVTITPDLGEIPTGKLRNFAGGARYVDAGEAAFEAALPRVASLLPWLRD
jgi:NTE family protein